MTKLTQSEIEYISFTIEKEAAQAAQDAGYSGEHGDRGAGRMREKLKYWKLGLAEEVPDEWKGIIKEYQNTNDPEYQDYLRLKNKFEK